MKKNYGKLIGVLAFVVMFLAVSVITLLYQSGIIKIDKKKVVEQVEETIEVKTTDSEEIEYLGDKLAIYTISGITSEDMDKYAKDFGGIVSDNSYAEGGYYEITLKDVIPEENKKYFLEEIRNHIAVSEAYFID